MTPDTEEPQRPAPSVFLSYASEDRAAAQLIRDALPRLGLEVWYDESALNGGDAWDQKIRRQIRECQFFIAIVSARTEARAEGYFRREWRLAVERAQDMADDHTFILPIVIDDTAQAGARVPEKFLGVQWLRLPGGEPNPAFEALCQRLVTGQHLEQPPRKSPPAAARSSSQSSVREYPPFPHEVPGQRVRFWAHVIGWLFQSGWAFFTRLPRWLRVVVYVWLGITVLVRGCAPPKELLDRYTPTDAKKIKTITDSYPGVSNKADLAKWGAQIAGEYADESDDDSAPASPVLAIPFTVPTGNPGAQKLADSTFAQMYGKVAVTHHGHVALVDQPLPAADAAAAAEQGRAHHANFVVYGSVDTQSPPALGLKIVRVADASVVWSESQPVATADPARLAAEVDTKMQSLQEE